MRTSRRAVPRRSTIRAILAALLTTGLALSGLALFTSTTHAAGLWTFTSNDMAHARGNATATALPDGKVLVAGGIINGTVLKSAEIYNPSTNLWTSTPDMTHARTDATATALPGGKVLVAGGSGSNDATDNLDSAEIYDLSTNTWSETKTNMAFARELATATALSDDEVLVTGGINSVDGVLSSAEIYDQSDNSWTVASSMTNARLGAAAARVGDKVLIAGGVGNSGVLKSSEIYDPSTKKWANTDMTQARAGATATTLSSGKVLVAGGFGSRNDALSSAEIYDPSAIPPTESWTATSSMAEAREFATATALPDGKVLVAGGNGNSDNSLATAELYDQNQGRWASAGSMNSPRTKASAAILPNGNVLVAGGIQSGPLASAEVYWPTPAQTTIPQVDSYGFSHTYTQSNFDYLPVWRDDNTFTISLKSPSQSTPTPPGSITFSSQIKGVNTDTSVNIVNGIAKVPITNKPGHYSYFVTYNPCSIGENQCAASEFYSASEIISGLHVFDVVKEQSKTILGAIPTVDSWAPGKSVELTATITNPNNNEAPTPTGTVEFLDGQTSLGSAPIGIDGKSHLTTQMSAGQHDIFAKYSGSGVYEASDSARLSQTVAKAESETTINPAATPPTAGTKATYTVTVTTPSGLTPTGTVALTADGNPVTSPNGGDLTAQPDGSMAATFTLDHAVADTKLHATYSGNANLNGSTDDLTQTVTKAESETTINPAATPPTAGTKATYTVTVTTPSGLTPTGTVALTADGNPVTSPNGGDLTAQPD
ncbi:kelch repeat-containing protein, partial [Kitasatospora sp. NPDC048540]|uniref:kelch repeat-containing protein n=1 Tax=Kitasatospora sp. NPDC048540 TaxID=3155634 RepID=UPI0033EF8DFA